MDYIIETIKQNGFVIFIALTGVFGCLTLSLAARGLNKLYVESLMMTTTANAFLKQLKLRRENGMRINSSIHNTYAFVCKNMDKYKYLNMTIRDYIKMAWFIQLLCVMFGLVAGLINQNVWFTAYGCVCAIAVSCVSKMEDLSYKQQQIAMNIVDYFDNIVTADIKVLDEDDAKDSKNQEDDANNCANENMNSEQRTAQQAGDENVQGVIIDADKRKLIEEVLKEYLA